MVVVTPVFFQVPTFQSSTEEMFPAVAEPELPPLGFTEVLPDVLSVLPLVLLPELLARPCRYSALFRKLVSSVRFS